MRKEAITPQVGQSYRFSHAVGLNAKVRIPEDTDVRVTEDLGDFFEIGFTHEEGLETFTTVKRAVLEKLIAQEREYFL